MKNLRYTSLAAANAATNQNGAAIDASQMLYVSLQGVSTGTATGTLKLQASNDYLPLSEPQNFAPTNWSDIPSATVAVTAASVTLIPKTEICYRWIRVVFTTSAGTGTITANLNAFSL